MKLSVLSFTVPLAEVEICKGKNKGCLFAHHEAYRGSRFIVSDEMSVQFHNLVD
jgi:hypothetical protein